MKPNDAAGKVDQLRAGTSWQAELSARPWREATCQVRKARRPHGWKTTPHGLVERARQGDARALESLCEAYRDSVRNYLRQRPNTDYELAEDATQELFTGLVRRDDKRNDLARLKLGPKDSFGAWLAGGAKNARSNALKREKRHQPLALESCSEARDSADEGAAPAPGSAAWRLAARRRADLRRAENRAKQLFELSAQEQTRYQNMPPDRLLDLARAIELVEKAFAQLEPEYDRRVFEHLKTTLLEEVVKPYPSYPLDLKFCQKLDVDRATLASTRSVMRWEKLPAAMRMLQEARRARDPNTPALGAPSTSLREELRELASALGH